MRMAIIVVANGSPKLDFDLLVGVQGVCWPLCLLVFLPVIGVG